SNYIFASSARSLLWTDSHTAASIHLLVHIKPTLDVPQSLTYHFRFLVASDALFSRSCARYIPAFSSVRSDWVLAKSLIATKRAVRSGWARERATPREADKTNPPYSQTDIPESFPPLLFPCCFWYRFFPLYGDRIRTKKSVRSHHTCSYQQQQYYCNSWVTAALAPAQEAQYHKPKHRSRSRSGGTARTHFGFHPGSYTQTASRLLPVNSLNSVSYPPLNPP
ncbi:hypothetical protein BDD12DRAFT_981092, partial [Trichophaea hybrida]